MGDPGPLGVTSSSRPHNDELIFGARAGLSSEALAKEEAHAPAIEAGRNVLRKLGKLLENNKKIKVEKPIRNAMLDSTCQYSTGSALRKNHQISKILLHGGGSMVSHVNTVTFSGLEAIAVDVQAHAPGTGQFKVAIVGLADKAVNESKERVFAALNSIGLSMPQGRVTVNLAPADLAKEGTHYDLPIILALMLEMKLIDPELLDKYVVLGELTLDAKIFEVPGVLPASMHANSLGKGIICPEANKIEAAFSGNREILAVANILQLLNHLKGKQVIAQPVLPQMSNFQVTHPDLKDVKGQVAAKRALEIAAAGGHNLLMVGPPGSGKSMLASRLLGILPDLTSKELLEINMINSIANKLKKEDFKIARPYRDPHHSASMVSLVGGGKVPKPGEISLAHNGILFLDELPEFPRNVLDALRQPMETGYVTISRAAGHVQFPASFQMVAAMNPCKCGYLLDPTKACLMAPRCGTTYQQRISGPLLDRIDINIEVPALNINELAADVEGESSKDVAARVKAAAQIQQERYNSYDIRMNAKITPQMMKQYIKPTDAAKDMLLKAMTKLKFSMRSYNRILKLARTIADLESCEVVDKRHVAEAIRYKL